MCFPSKAGIYLGRAGRVLLILCFLPLMVSGSAFGVIGGSIDLTSVESTEDGVHRSSLKQDLQLNATRNLSPYLSLRGAVRYFRFALDQQAAANSWREDFQPSGELTWRHPLFSFDGTLGRRVSDARNALGKLTTDEADLSFRTRSIRYPLLTLRYDAEHIESRADSIPTETRERRYAAGLDYSLGRQTFSCSLDRRNDENQISGLDTRFTNSIFRWTGGSPSLAGGRLQITTDYSFRYGEATSERPSPGVILNQIPIVVGLYAEDTSPDLGDLAPAPGLIDGDRSTPTEPRIDIGAGFVDRNVGADLGFQRSVSALYIYVDRPSGSALRWQVYTSMDNLSWSLVTAGVSVAWNLSLSRYEIEFGSVSTRYVKAVNNGLNDIVDVYVTEIAAFEELANARRITQHQTTHAADLVASYRFSSRVSSTANLLYQRAPVGESDTRDLGGYALSTNYQMSRIFLQTLRWQQDFEKFGQGIQNRRTDAIDYGFFANPTEALQVRISGLDRVEWAADSRERETRTGGLQVVGSLLEPVRVTCDLIRSRNSEFSSDSHVDSWETTISTDANITDGLDMTIGLGRQRTTSAPADLRRVRKSLDTGFTYRLSGTILAQGTLEFIRDVEDSRTQDYLLSWSMTPRVTVGGQASLISLGSSYRSRTYGANLNITLKPNTVIYLNVSDLDLSRAGGSRSTSYQQGFRTAL